MANDIVIRVGAALDRSTDAVWAEIKKQQQRAFETTKSEAGKAAGIQKIATAQQVATAKAAAQQQMQIARAQYAEQSKLNRTIAAEQLRTERALALQERALARERTRDKLQALSQEERAEKQHQDRLMRMKLNSARESNRIQRQQERENLRAQYAQAREIDRFATRTSHRATRFFFPRPEGMLGYGRRVAGDLARGAGVDFSLSSGVAKARDLEKEAYFLSSKGYFAGTQGEAGKRVAPKTLIEEARNVANAQALDPNAVLEAQAAYVGLTGDLTTARSLMEELAALSGATGSDMIDLGRAAGAMGNAIGEGSQAGAEKANVLLGVMRLLASQGKLTAIEMDTLAKHMPKLAGASRMYSDVPKTIAEFGALGQLSMGGGAWNAGSATTAMAGFTAEISSSKAAKEFKRLDIERYDRKTRMLRSPIDLIKEMVEKTGGSPEQISKVVSGTRGGRMVNWLAAEYRRTGNWESTDKRISELTNVGTLSKENIAEINAKRMETTASKAQLFQNQLDKITESLAGKLLPTFEQLTPKILKVANAFSGMVAWAAANPWETVMAALGVSVARAATESFGRLILERGITGLLGGVGGNAVGGAAGSAAGGLLSKGAGAIGGALTSGAATGAGVAMNAAAVLGIGVATFMVTDAIINSANTTVRESEQSRGKESNSIFQTFAKEYSSATNDADRQAAMMRAKHNAEQVEGNRGFVDRLFGSQDVFLGTMKAIGEFAKENDERRRKGASSIDAAAALGAPAGSKVSENNLATAMASALTNRPIQVYLTNPNDIKFDIPPQGGAATSTPVSGPPTFSPLRGP